MPVESDCSLQVLCVLCTFLKGSEDSSGSLTSSPMQKSDMVWPHLILKQFVYGIYTVCYCYII